MLFRGSIALATAFIAAVTSFAASSTTAGGPRSDFQHLKWKAPVIRVAVSSSLTSTAAPNIKSDSDVLGALQRSIRSWESVADVRIQVEPSDKQNVSAAGVTGDGVSLITIAATAENALFFARDPNSASAKTRIFYDRKGFITEADIVLNPFQQFSTDGTFGTFDLEATLTHELGHLLGLRHSDVLGSTMADGFPRVGTFGIIDLGPRTLGESDIAAIREVYGAPAGTEDCCATVSGRLTTGGKPAKGLTVWAEEDRTGRVMAQAETGVDGSYSLGGLRQGNYALFWRSERAIGELGPIHLDTGDERSFNAKVDVRNERVLSRFIGMNSQMADLGLQLSPGRSYLLYVGGHDLSPDDSIVEFNSPYFTVTPGSMTAQDFNGNVAGISFTINVHPSTPAGEYTVFVSGQTGIRSCLIGALSVE